MQEMCQVPTMEKIPMAIQANTRVLLSSQNLVLYVDVEFTNDGRTMETFLLEIHEETEKRIERNYPLLPSANDPLFHSFGKRVAELQAALTFIDVLYGYSASKGYRAILESWLLHLKDRRPIRYTVCIQVRYQGKLQDPMQPASRLAHQFVSHPPELVQEDGPSEIHEAVRTVINNGQNMTKEKGYKL